MFRFRSAIDSATRSDARHQAEVTSWWRDWHRYLHAQLQLLDARQAEATTPPSFERTDDAWEQQRATAEQVLRRIPHDRRAVFDRTREARRAPTEAELGTTGRANGATPQPLDPDTVERETLRRLLAQAEGSGDGGEQWGAVPLPSGWYELQVDALLRAPTAAEYALTTDEGDERRKRLLLLGGLLLLGVIAVWWTWPRAEAAARAPASTEVLVNGQPAARWQIRAVTVVDAAGGRTTLAVTATDVLAWPAATRATGAAGGAWWRTTALHPLELCLPPAVLKAATTVELHGGGDLPTRHYALEAVATSRPDLLLHACGSENGAGPRSGVLAGSTGLPDQPLAEGVTLNPDGPVLRVESFEVLGAGHDPQLPAGTARVVVRVAAPAELDWAALRPSLLLQNGSPLLPSNGISERPGSGLVEVAYLVPTWQVPMAVAWSVTDPRTAAQVRWRVTLDPPRSRAAVLREWLDVTVSGRRGVERGSATLLLRLRNTSTTPLVLTNADLVVTQGDRAIPVSAVATAGLAISPQETHTLEVPLREIDLAQEVRVRVGAAGFRLRFGAEEGGAADSGS